MYPSGLNRFFKAICQHFHHFLKIRFQDVAMLPVSGAQAAEEHEASFPRSRRAAVSHDKKVETFDVAPSDHDDDADMLQRKYHLSYAVSDFYLG